MKKRERAAVERRVETRSEPAVDDDPLTQIKLPADPPRPQPVWFVVAVLLWGAWLGFLMVLALGY